MVYAFDLLNDWAPESSTLSAGGDGDDVVKAHDDAVLFGKVWYYLSGGRINPHDRRPASRPIRWRRAWCQRTGRRSAGGTIALLHERSTHARRLADMRAHLRVRHQTARGHRQRPKAVTRSASSGVHGIDQPPVTGWEEFVSGAAAAALKAIFATASWAFSMARVTSAISCFRSFSAA